MNLDRKIKLFFVSYGRLLFTIIAVIIGFIYILQNFNNFAKRQNDLKEEKKVIRQQELKQDNEIKKIISEFIDYCISGKIDKAYEMLSEKCKKERFTTQEFFKKQYIDNIFNIKICKYDIEKKENFYTVTLTEDMLITGKINSIKQINLVVENKKIYIQYK